MSTSRDVSPLFLSCLDRIFQHWHLSVFFGSLLTVSLELVIGALWLTTRTLPSSSSTSESRRWVSRCLFRLAFRDVDVYSYPRLIFCSSPSTLIWLLSHFQLFFSNRRQRELEKPNLTLSELLLQSGKSKRNIIIYFMKRTSKSCWLKLLEEITGASRPTEASKLRILTVKAWVSPYTSLPFNLLNIPRKYLLLHSSTSEASSIAISSSWRWFSLWSFLYLSRIIAPSLPIRLFSLFSL